MTESFKPNSLTVNKFLTDSDSFYQIPKYQRPYKWNDEQVDKLWDDLWESYTNETSNYFLGSVITAKAVGDQYLDIVDGQQRLTTLMILMAVVRDLYPTLNEDDSENVNAIDETTIKNAIAKDGKFKRLRLYTHINHQTDFDQIILNGNTLEIKKPFKKDVRIDEVPKYKFQNTACLFREKLEKIGLQECGKFINYIFNNVYIIRIDCSDVSFAIKLFQVLNARGLDLTNADLIKSFLLGNLLSKYGEDPTTALLKENQFLQDWIHIEKIASSVDQSTNDLLVMYEYYLLESNPKKSLYDELVSQFENDDPLEIIADFKAFCNHYQDSIIGVDDEVLYSFYYLPWAIYWRTVLLTALHEGYSEYKELTEAVRNFYYQHWIAGYTLSRVKQASFNLIKWIKEKRPLNEIKNELSSIAKSNNIPTRMFQNLNGDVYGEAWIKPILFVVENHQSDSPTKLEMKNREIHVEHILPQKFDTLYGWKEMIEDKDFSKTLIHTLGNLTLLSGKKNIEARNNPYEDKIKTYQGKGLYNMDDHQITSFRISQKLVDEYNENKYSKAWNKIAIADRKTWMWQQIESIFKIKIEDTK